MTKLEDQRCVPCEEGALPMEREEAESLMSDIAGWELVEEDNLKLVRKFTFPDFREALTFVNKVGAIAEAENHHPDILIVYRRVTLTLFTHEVGGLSMNDFVLAAKINELFDK